MSWQIVVRLLVFKASFGGIKDKVPTTVDLTFRI